VQQCGDGAPEGVGDRPREAGTVEDLTDGGIAVALVPLLLVVVQECWCSKDEALAAGTGGPLI